MVIWDSLAPGGNPDDILRKAGQGHNREAILIVGHEPVLSIIISRTIAGAENASIALAKGGLAKIRNFSFIRGPPGNCNGLLTRN